MKHIASLAAVLLLSISLFSLQTKAQGWPSGYGGVMLQGFYWDSYADSQWSYLESQADDLAPYFSLIWAPPSANANSIGGNMGYYPAYFFNQNSSFGTEGQLRSMIQTYKQKGTGIIADVVVNHHADNGTQPYNAFFSETYNGTTYSLQSSDICRNDEISSQATGLSTNNDTGDNDGGCRDLDHKSQNVNAIVKAYEQFLLNDLGYTGFRYDMVKGYSASYIADYNGTSKPSFSVGENWSGTGTIKSWIDGTKGTDGTPTSAAFDFQFRYRMRNAVSTGNWANLSAASQGADGKPLIQTPAYRQYAVTFVDNHDMRDTSGENAPITTNVTAANAFLLSMPGTPCVFYRHWLSHKKDIKMMIEARRLAGIQNTSSYEQLRSTASNYAVRTTGTKGSLLCVVGSAPTAYVADADYRLLCSGSDYCLYINSAAYADWDATKARIEEEEKGTAFTPYDITIYCSADFSPLYFYAWDASGKQLIGSWPGKQMTQTKQVDGKTWYYQTFSITSADYYVNIIFNQGNNKPQTSDIQRLTTDKYFTATISGGKVAYTDVTSTTGISHIDAPSAADTGKKARVITDGQGIFIEQPDGTRYTLDGKKAN